MEMSFHAIALIPAYNPGIVLLVVLSKAKAAGLFLIVVNDGSNATHAEVFVKARIYGVVLNHSRNLGKGSALKTGLFYIRKKYPGNSFIVTMDADGQHRVDDAARVLAQAVLNPEILVLGSRDFRTGVPVRSKLGNMAT